MGGLPGSQPQASLAGCTIEAGRPLQGRPANSQRCDTDAAAAVAEPHHRAGLRFSGGSTQPHQTTLLGLPSDSKIVEERCNVAVIALHVE